ncbi:hypothetical protein SAMD00079811_51770 [Scytonema sp. HK-05]|uniref:VMAP-C domain-containing protein n=1 Tax=Scytonema sp. HK-05 TaxID=1137095 RepID=UPI000935A27D|nr:hypothetical protein [Scytonema sp. HK-05]OKH58065.1 hypothetical protein NIES2130_16220 [Scytonema sp. HK-05]BAY47559.1 hypothetical protein SAMD00079811_51770 [Scytonema sp. HK-05]
MGEINQPLIKKLYEERLSKLEKDLTDVFAQLNRTENAQSRNNLQRQIEEIEQEMNTIEQKLKSISQTKVTAHPLLQILEPYVDSTITYINRAYQACCPEGFSQQPDTVEGILEILQDIRGNNPQFAPIARFVAHLVLDFNIPKALRDELQKWGENNIKDFNQLREDIQKDNNSDIQDANSYLVIRVKPKTKKIDRFYISAWLIPDIRCYKPQNYDGFQTLDVSKSSTKTFTLAEIPQIVESLLNQSSSYVLRNLTVEFFLPSQLLNHEVDSFIKKEFNYAETIGKKYRVFVRANERLEKNYPYKGLWYDKWQKLKQAYNCQCRQELVSKNYTLEVLRKKLDKAIGLIFIKVPEPTSHEKFFSLLLITATPIALCLRKEIKLQAVVKNSLLDCCIQELPEKVKEKRLDAPQDKDDHIGHHLSLVWEDPERLTPDAEYFYSLPQSVS